MNISSTKAPLSRLLAALGLLLVAGAPGLAAAEAPGLAAAEGAVPLTLEEAIERALRQHPDVGSADEEVVAARAARRGARGQFGPRLRVEANATRWDEALEASFGLPGMTEGPSIIVRDQVTFGLSVSIVQPLTPLWGIYESYRIQDLGVDVAEIQRRATHRDIAWQATEAYVRVLQARSLVSVAEQSVAQLEAQVRLAQIHEEQGQVGRNDVLRAELGLASARQRVIQARGQATLAERRLAVAVGARATDRVEPRGDPAHGAPSPAPSAEAVAADALAGRVEIREIESRIRQAEAGVNAARSQLLPQVSAMGTYQLNTGSAFSQREATFVGLVATWDAFTWGTRWAQVPEAQARLRQATLGRQRVRDGILLEAEAARVTMVAAAEALEVARASLAQAEENFRIESLRYEAGANTSFDVIDAEALLTQARLQERQALYDHFIAEAGLRRAVGRWPIEQKARQSR